MFKFSKYICILSILAAPFVFKPNAALAGGGFTASCFDIKFKAPSTLEANCLYMGGKFNSFDWVDLNAHITNNNGTLAWQKNGGFAASVRNCRIVNSGSTILLCEAGDGKGNWLNSFIVLDDKIANYNGSLTVLDGF